MIKDRINSILDYFTIYLKVVAHLPWKSQIEFLNGPLIDVRIYF